MTIRYQDIPDPDADQIAPLRRALLAYNETRLGDYRAQGFMVTACAEDGGMLGAVQGHVQFGWLYVGMLWVSEAARRQGVGSTLLARIEAWASGRGVHRSRLATSDFQPGYHLYLRRGYSVYAEIPIMPDAEGRDRHVEYLMWKNWGGKS